MFQDTHQQATSVSMSVGSGGSDWTDILTAVGTCGSVLLALLGFLWSIRLQRHLDDIRTKERKEDALAQRRAELRAAYSEFRSVVNEAVAVSQTFYSKHRTYKALGDLIETTKKQVLDKPELLAGAIIPATAQLMQWYEDKTDALIGTNARLGAALSKLEFWETNEKRLAALRPQQEQLLRSVTTIATFPVDGEQSVLDKADRDATTSSAAINAIIASVGTEHRDHL